MDIVLPVPAADFLERYEGMLARMPQTMYVTEHFQLDRFGQVVLSPGDRLFQPTEVAMPGAPALAVAEANALNRIILDDAGNSQNPTRVQGRGGLPLSASNTLRGGDRVTGVTGEGVPVFDAGYGSTRGRRLAKGREPPRAELFSGARPSGPRAQLRAARLEAGLPRRQLGDRVRAPDPEPAIVLVDVRSSEPDDGVGDGDTAGDVVRVGALGPARAPGGLCIRAALPCDLSQ